MTTFGIKVLLSCNFIFRQALDKHYAHKWIAKTHYPYNYILQLLMCGTANVSVEDLWTHTVVEGHGTRWEETLSWFWAAVQGFTSEDMSKFLQFVTGSSRLPARGFVDLSHPICIRSLSGQHGHLPFAATW